MRKVPDVSGAVTLPLHSTTIRAATIVAAFLAAAGGTASAEPEIWACGHKPAPINEAPVDGKRRVPSGGLTINLSTPRDPTDRTPRGGAYGYADRVSNLRSNLEDPLRITSFDAACDAVVLDGLPLDGKATNGYVNGYDITEARDSALVFFGESGAVVLRGVSLALWQAGAAQQHRGTEANDALLGSDADEVFWSGGGNDTIAPGAGDDRIGYSMDDDLILNTPANLGVDTLDLRRFSTERMRVKLLGKDLVITTPDGKITLQDQLTSAGNVEIILLADDKILTSAELQALAAR